MNENSFKKKQIKEWKEEYPKFTSFCIETEETEPGFPDVMMFNIKTTEARFWEIKSSDMKGVIEFERSQPIFYKKHPEMNIFVCAQDSRDGTVHHFPADALFENNGVYSMDSKRRVQL